GHVERLTLRDGGRLVVTKVERGVRGQAAVAAGGAGGTVGQRRADGVGDVHPLRAGPADPWHVAPLLGSNAPASRGDGVDVDGADDHVLGPTVGAGGVRRVGTALG